MPTGSSVPAQRATPSALGGGTVLERSAVSRRALTTTRSSVKAARRRAAATNHDQRQPATHNCHARGRGFESRRTTSSAACSRSPSSPSTWPETRRPRATRSRCGRKAAAAFDGRHSAIGLAAPPPARWPDTTSNNCALPPSYRGTAAAHVVHCGRASDARPDSALRPPRACRDERGRRCDPDWLFKMNGPLAKAGRSGWRERAELSAGRGGCGTFNPSLEHSLCCLQYRRPGTTRPTSNGG
jgi:hypothetical protein